MCQSPTIEKKGVGKNGKPWHAFFCQNPDCKDPNWVYEEKPASQNRATASTGGTEAFIKPKTTQDATLPPKLKPADLTQLDKIEMLLEGMRKDIQVVLDILKKEIGNDEVNEELNQEEENQ